MNPILATLFWLSATLLAYTFLGYPILVHLLGKACGRSPVGAATGATQTPVSVVLVVRNEAERAIPRITNLLDSDYPAGRIEIILVSDGSSDDTVQRIERAKLGKVRVIASDTHRGKPPCLNDGVAAAAGEIIVFADARQRFTPSTIPGLVSRFSDPDVGAVSGDLVIEASSSGVGSGVDAYWRLEKAIRLGESRLDSSIGCTGAVYAIRKSCYAPLPDDTILDDVVCPMQVALSGKRVLFAPEAVAFDPQSLEPENEARRKRRTLAGNYQMLFRYPGWLLPWRNRLCIQLISHKYLRLAAPLFMAVLLAVSLALAAGGSIFFMSAAAGQILFYALAATGLAIPTLRWKIVAIPAGFLFLNLMTLRGFIFYFKQRGASGW